MAYEPEWGVGVDQVSALAPHVTIAEGAAPEAPADSVYSDRGIHKITAAQVEEWISGISARVAGRLWLLPQLAQDHPAREGLIAEARDVVANGAAAYLVDAAFPGKAAPNDNTSYGSVLRARYEDGLADLEARLGAIIAGAEPGGAVAGPAPISFEFPLSSFPDYMRF